MPNVPPKGQRELDCKIGINIQRAMERAKLTHEQLAEKIGVDRVNITRYANGQRQCPTVILSKIADACHVSVDYLIGRSRTRIENASVAAFCNFAGLSEDALWNIHCQLDGEENAEISAALIESKCLREMFSDDFEDFSERFSDPTEDVYGFELIDAILSDGSLYRILQEITDARDYLCAALEELNEWEEQKESYKSFHSSYFEKFELRQLHVKKEISRIEHQLFGDLEKRYNNMLDSYKDWEKEREQSFDE